MLKAGRSKIKEADHAAPSNRKLQRSAIYPFDMFSKIEFLALLGT